MIKRILIFIIIILFGISAGTSAQLTKEEKRQQKRTILKYLKKINAHIDENKFTEALPLTDSILALDDSNPDGIFFKGFILSNLADTSNALVILEQGMTKAPLSSKIKTLTARIYLQKNMLDTALAISNSILMIKPRHSEALYINGDIYLKKNDTVNALKYYDESLQIELTEN